MSERYTTKCPHCGETIGLDFHNEAGDIISCHNCDTDLEIVKMHPPKLKVSRRYGPLEEQDEYFDNFDELEENEEHEEKDFSEDRFSI